MLFYSVKATKRSSPIVLTDQSSSKVSRQSSRSRKPSRKVLEQTETEVPLKTIKTDNSKSNLELMKTKRTAKQGASKKIPVNPTDESAPTGKSAAKGKKKKEVSLGAARIPIPAKQLSEKKISIQKSPSATREVSNHPSATIDSNKACRGAEESLDDVRRDISNMVSTNDVNESTARGTPAGTEHGLSAPTEFPMNNTLTDCASSAKSNGPAGTNEI